MAPADARKKIEQQKRKNKLNKRRPTSGGIRKPVVTGGKIKDLRQVLTKKKTVKRTPTKRKRELASDSKRTRPRSTSRNQSKSRRGQPATSGSKNNPSRRYSNNNNNNNNNQRVAQPPTYIISTQAPPHPAHTLAMDNVEQNQSASVLISNLLPTITQSDIIELFGDVGSMTAVNMINQTTALVTYQHSGDAVRAVKVYHNRLLDGKPMMVNMMPIPPGSSTNIRQRVGHPSVVGSSQTMYTPRR